MPPVEDHAQLASDAELITRVRAGDRSAFGDLYSRHAGAALALARQFSRSVTEADDLVSEAFARVLDGMLESRGPDTAFRAYLFTTVRNTAYDRTRKDKRLQFSDDMESHDVAVDGDDPIIAELEKGLIGKAFAGLPERWQTVLWHLQVEGQSAAEVGVLLGMAPNAVSSLAFRAREGLREAYLQAHLAETAAERCRTTVDRLGAWTRGGLSKREKAQVDAHLEECDRCPALAVELSEINTGLRGLLAPLLLGGAAVGYLATLGPVVPLAQLGLLTGGKAAAGLGGKTVFGGKAAAGGKAVAGGSKSIGGHAAAGLAKIGSFGPGAVVAGVAAAVAVVVTGVAIALSVGHSAPSTAGAEAGVAAAVTSGPVAGGGAARSSGGGGGAVAPGATTSISSSAKSSTVPTSGSSTSAPATSSANPRATTPIDRGIVIPATTRSIPSTPAAPIAKVIAGPTTPTSAGSSTSPSTQPSTSTPTTITTTPTTTPSPAALRVGNGTIVSPNLIVGGSGRLSLQIANTGNTPSDAGQRMQLKVPAGVRIDQPALTLSLRGGSRAVAAAAAPDICSDAVGSTITCTLPAVAAGKTLTFTFTITAGPDAMASSTIDVTIADGTSTNIAVHVGSGYREVSVTSADELGRASTGIVTLQVTPRVAGSDTGALSFPLAIAPGITITEFATESGVDTGCSIIGDHLLCPSGAATAGIQVVVSVAKAATTGVAATAPATDQGGRKLSTGSLTVSASRYGGYTDANPVELDPAGLLAPGTSTTITLIGHPLPGVLDPGPIVIPVSLTDGAGVDVDLDNLPTGCATTPAATPADSTVTCSPAGNQGSATFVLPVNVAPDAVGGTPSPVVLPFPGAPTPVTAGGPLTVKLETSSYEQITARVDGLTAGANGSLTLTGTSITGVTTPGKVTVPTDLGSGVNITAVVSGDCSRIGTTWVCTAASNGQSPTWKLQLHTDPDAGQGALTLPEATLPGTASMPLIPDHTDLLIRGAATTCSPPATLTNGNFSAPQVPEGAGHDVRNSDTTVWQTTAPDSQIEYWRNGSGSTAANNGVPITGQGDNSQWIEVNGNSADTISQEIATVPGQTIRWSLHHRGRAVAGYDGFDTMEVKIGSPNWGTVAQVPDPTADPNSRLDPHHPTWIIDGPASWVLQTGSYPVPDGQTTTRFEFAALRTSSGDQRIGNFLDGVSVDSGPCLQTSTAVTNVTTGVTGSSTAQPGDVLKYDTTITNVGTDTASNPTLSSTSPANTTEVFRTTDGSTLGAGQRMHITLTVRIKADVPDSAVISDNAVVTYQWPPASSLLTAISNTVDVRVAAPQNGTPVTRSRGFR